MSDLKLGDLLQGLFTSHFMVEKCTTGELIKLYHAEITSYIKKLNLIEIVQKKEESKEETKSFYIVVEKGGYVSQWDDLNCLMEESRLAKMDRNLVVKVTFDGKDSKAEVVDIKGIG